MQTRIRPRVLQRRHRCLTDFAPVDHCHDREAPPQQAIKRQPRQACRQAKEAPGARLAQPEPIGNHGNDCAARVQKLIIEHLSHVSADHLAQHDLGSGTTSIESYSCGQGLHGGRLSEPTEARQNQID